MGTLGYQLSTFSVQTGLIVPPPSLLLGISSLLLPQLDSSPGSIPKALWNWLPSHHAANL
jgi:hypothetical protein